MISVFLLLLCRSMWETCPFLKIEIFTAKSDHASNRFDANRQQKSFLWLLQKYCSRFYSLLVKCWRFSTPWLHNTPRKNCVDEKYCDSVALANGRRICRRFYVQSAENAVSHNCVDRNHWRFPKFHGGNNLFKFSKPIILTMLVKKNAQKEETEQFKNLKTIWWSWIKRMNYLLW